MTPLSIPGIENGYKVDDSVWRGAQPADSAWPLLAAAGVKLVVDLNSTGDAIQQQAKLAQLAGIQHFFPASWSGILPPSQERVDSAIQIIRSYPGPAFIHCLHGSDRTGTLCAIWRMFHDRWDFDDAMAEAFTSLGLQGMHEFWFSAAVAQYAHDRNLSKEPK